MLTGSLQELRFGVWNLLRGFDPAHGCSCRGLDGLSDVEPGFASLRHDASIIRRTS